tara:strand:- start:1362 stop:1907 length:546 start_codon:yes stop_codon:yes gene_type:complete
MAKKEFHIDEPREIGKKKIRIKKDDVLLVKKQIEERKQVMILKKFMNESKDDTMDSVGILIFYRNRMLTTQRTSGQWSIPKGRIKENEDPVSAVQREVIEELGFQLPKIPRKIKVFHKENGGIFHVYAVILDRMETIHLNHEHEQYHWEEYDKERGGIRLTQGFDPDILPVIMGIFGARDV